MSPSSLTSGARSRRRGFVMVTMLLSLVVLLAFLGLAIDVGYEQWVKTRMQTAADAAALGGAQELKVSGAGNLVAAAKSDAAANGFADGQNSVTVTVNNPPASGYSTADSSAVEVLISQSVPTYFMQMLGFFSANVEARAVAHVGGGTTCFYVLDPSMSNALIVNNGVTATMACGVMVDSSSNSALDVTGGSHLNAPFIGVDGKYTVNNGSSISPTPTQGVPAVANPLASLPKPTVGACTYTNENIGWAPGTTILNPGTYCNGLTIANGATASLNPGMYIFKGGGFTIAGGAHVSGSGVTFYNSYGTGYSYAPITFNNGTTITFSAPTTGTYAGILIYQDPSVVSSSINTFAGGTNANLTGTLYFPTTGLSFSNGASAAYTIIVADNVSFSGGVTIKNDYSSLPGGSPIKGNAALSE